MHCLFVKEIHDFENFYVYCILFKVYIIGMYCILYIIEMYWGHDTKVWKI